MSASRRKAVVVGAGPAGLFAARKLVRNGVDVTLLEKEDVVGGKCHTYSDPENPELKTEWGAMILASNYGVVLDAVKEQQIEFEETVSANMETVEIFNRFKYKSLAQKAYFAASISNQLAVYTYKVKQYLNSRNNSMSLPCDYELPFEQFAEKYGLEDINCLLKPFVPGFGYGAMNEIPAYAVMEYTGLSSLPSMLADYTIGKKSLVTIKGGMQFLMEKVAKDLNVVKSANITRIHRSQGNVKITYTLNGVSKKIDADMLVLATSPLQWPKLGMRLTETEQACVDKLTYYRYPVAVCHIKGIKPEMHYVQQALEKEGFGHLALVTTKDNRQSPESGRLCTSYVNLPAGKNNYRLDKGSRERNKLKKDISQLGGVKQVKIKDTRIWEDYMPTLSWNQRLKLEKEQMRSDISTLYVGAYPVGGFEDVRCVADQATKAVAKHVLHEAPESTVSYVKKELSRAYNFFFNTPVRKPVEEFKKNGLGA